MRIAVYEDDLPYAKKIESIIRNHTHYPTAINTAIYSDMASFVGRQNDALLYFIDIVHHESTKGFDIAKIIASENTGSLIAFITQYPKMILSNAEYKVLAFNVILKNDHSHLQEITETIDLAQQLFNKKCMFIYTDKYERLTLPYSSIYFVRVTGKNKLCIYAKKGVYIINGALSKLLQEFHESGQTQFIRCHRQSIVNMDNEHEFLMDKTNSYLVFENGLQCPYSPLLIRRTTSHGSDRDNSYK